MPVSNITLSSISPLLYTMKCLLPNCIRRHVIMNFSGYFGVLANCYTFLKLVYKPQQCIFLDYLSDQKVYKCLVTDGGMVIPILLHIQIYLLLPSKSLFFIPPYQLPLHLLLPLHPLPSLLHLITSPL